jgi:hypothetical protein
MDIGRFLGPLVVGAALIWLARSLDDRGARRAFTWAIVGSVILAIESSLLTICGIAENRSELYNDRCEGGTPFLPLLGIPFLLLTAVAYARTRVTLLWVVGIAGFVVALVVPWELLSV